MIDGEDNIPVKIAVHVSWEPPTLQQGDDGIEIVYTTYLMPLVNWWHWLEHGKVLHGAN